MYKILILTSLAVLGWNKVHGALDEDCFPYTENNLGPRESGEIAQNTSKAGLPKKRSGKIGAKFTSESTVKFVCNEEKAFTISDESVSWERANQLCLSKGMRLASVRSKEEHAEILSMAKQHGRIKVWIGANDLAESKTYRWADGSLIPSNLQFWADGQPNHVYNGIKENCVVLGVNDGWLWHDHPCFTEFYYFCERFSTGSCKM